MPAVDVAIQIVNYKTKAFLNPLIRSILQDTLSSSLSVEINIIDNASGDNLNDIARKWHGHAVHIYQSNNNGGFGAGHNILAAKTKARYLLILNPDMIFIEPRTIERLLSAMHKTSAAVVGPRLLTPRSRSDTALHRLSADELKIQPWDHGRYYVGHFWQHQIDNHLRKVAWVSGAAFLIERQLFNEIGGFDENFFLYYEEVDICRRLRQKGAHIVYDPTIHIIHYGGAVASKRKYLLSSLWYFQRKHWKRI